MATDRKRLRKLLTVQEQLKALHEARHAGHLAEAVRARQDADDLAARFEESAMAPLFPELFHRRIAGAVEREKESRDQAAQEAGKVAVATVRTTIVERDYRRAAAQEERESEARALLELIDRKAAAAK